jgi:hypothetical protein
VTKEINVKSPVTPKKIQIEKYLKLNVLVILSLIHCELDNGGCGRPKSFYNSRKIFPTPSCEIVLKITIDFFLTMKGLKNKRP